MKIIEITDCQTCPFCIDIDDFGHNQMCSLDYSIEPEDKYGKVKEDEDGWVDDPGREMPDDMIHYFCPLWEDDLSIKISQHILLKRDGKS